MPLALAPQGREMKIVRVSADARTCRHLANLGIAPGADIVLLALGSGSMIVRVCDSRLALDSATARAILVRPAA